MFSIHITLVVSKVAASIGEATDCLTQWAESSRSQRLACGPTHSCASALLGFADRPGAAGLTENVGFHHRTNEFR